MGNMEKSTARMDFLIAYNLKDFTLAQPVAASCNPVKIALFYQESQSKNKLLLFKCNNECC